MGMYTHSSPIEIQRMVVELYLNYSDILPWTHSYETIKHCLVEKL